MTKGEILNMTEKPIRHTEGKEVNLKEAKENTGMKEAKEPDIGKIKGMTLEAIVEENKEKLKLGEDEKKALKEKTGMTDANIEKCTVDKDGQIRLKCTNEEYAGKEHPETGVRYVEKDIDIDGVKIRVVAPEFKSIVDKMLPPELRQAPESKQFEYLNNWLKEEIKTNPALKAQFNKEQIAMIERGQKPTGYTWHHNEECGKMQLVEFKTHEKSGHTGGNSIWNGGN